MVLLSRTCFSITPTGLPSLTFLRVASSPTPPSSCLFRKWNTASTAAFDALLLATVSAAALLAAAASCFLFLGGMIAVPVEQLSSLSSPDSTQQATANVPDFYKRIDLTFE